jgi:hypothetical protein
MSQILPLPKRIYNARTLSGVSSMDKTDLQRPEMSDFLYMNCILGHF